MLLEFAWFQDNYGCSNKKMIILINYHVSFIVAS